MEHRSESDLVQDKPHLTRPSGLQVVANNASGRNVYTLADLSDSTTKRDVGERLLGCIRKRLGALQESNDKERWGVTLKEAIRDFNASCENTGGKKLPEYGTESQDFQQCFGSSLTQFHPTELDALFGLSFSELLTHAVRKQKTLKPFLDVTEIQSPFFQEIIRKEVEYFLSLDNVINYRSDWSSVIRRTIVKYNQTCGQSPSFPPPRGGQLVHFCKHYSIPATREAMGALLGIVDLLPEDRAIEHQVKPVIPTPEPQKQVKKSPKLELRHLLEESGHDILGLTTVNFDESNNIVASLEDTSKQFEEMVYKYIRSRFLSEQDDSYVVTFDRCIDTFMNVFHIQYIGEQRAIYFSFDYAGFERLERDLKHRTFKDGKPIITDLFPQFLSYLRDESAIQEYFANHFTEEVEQSDGIMIHFIPRTNFNMKDEQKKLSGANEGIKKGDTSDNPDAIGMETDLEEIGMVAKDPLMVEGNVDPHELVESDYR